MATKKEIIRGVLRASRPKKYPVFGGPKDGRPNVTVPKHQVRGPRRPKNPGRGPKTYY